MYKPLISSGESVPKALQDLIQVAEEMKVHELRQRIDTDAFQMFAEMFLRSIVRRRDWRLKHRRENLRNFVTVADESLALLTLENNITEWIDCATENRTEHQTRGEGTVDAQQNDQDDLVQKKKKQKKDPKTIYTHGGINSDGTKKGWSVQGIKRYNEIMRKVVGFRSDIRYTGVEEELRKRWKVSGKKVNDEQTKRRNQEDVEEEVEEALTGFDFE